MEIILTDGKTKCLIDDDDYNLIISHTTKWRLNGSGYVMGYSRIFHDNEFLHRIILKCPTGHVVDHLSGDKLDNRKLNLKIEKAGNNIQRSPKNPTNTSPYKGVSFDKRRNLFKSRAVINRSEVWLGYFKTAKEAAIAYDKEVVKYNVNAYLNFPNAS